MEAEARIRAWLAKGRWRKARDEAKLLRSTPSLTLAGGRRHSILVDITPHTPDHSAQHRRITRGSGG